jgi:hypothetical protein
MERCFQKGFDKADANRDFAGWAVILFVKDAPREFSEVDLLLREDGGR